MSRPATERQKRYLRQLVLEADGEVEEQWLESLTVDEASRYIDEYSGAAMGMRGSDLAQQRVTDRLEEWRSRRRRGEQA